MTAVTEQDELRCGRTGLYVTHCGHCRPPRTTPRPVFLEPPNHRVDDEEPYAVLSFPANTGDTCGDCDDWYNPGAWVTQMSDKTYRCTECS